jgi:REP element-mobilizing transposase RayT
MCVEDELHCPLLLQESSQFTTFVKTNTSAIMSATISLFHIVINTHGRRMTIPDETSEHMYRYIGAIIKSHNCRLFRINGIANHIHMLVGLPPTLALSDLVRDVKQGSSKWAKQQTYFPDFNGWGKEYGAFSCSIRDKDAIISYINNQRIHHAQRTFEQEYQDMIERTGLEWNEYRLT